MKTKALRTIKLEQLRKLSEVVAEQRKIEKETRQQTFITISGTFPIAKFRDKDGKKHLEEAPVTLERTPIEDLGSKWIEYVRHDGRRAYVKVDDAEKVVFRIIALETPEETAIEEVVNEDEVVEHFNEHMA